jgi:hypothetical protein
MIIKMFGIMDLIVALAFFINNFFDKTSDWFPNKIILVLAIYIIIKGLFFLFTWDLASIIDIICGILILLSTYWIIPAILASIVIIFLLQKAFFSFVS